MLISLYWCQNSYPKIKQMAKLVLHNQYWCFMNESDRNTLRCGSTKNESCVMMYTRPTLILNQYLTWQEHNRHSPFHYFDNCSLLWLMFVIKNENESWLTLWRDSKDKTDMLKRQNRNVLKCLWVTHSCWNWCTMQQKTLRKRNQMVIYF